MQTIRTNNEWFIRYSKADKQTTSGLTNGGQGRILSWTPSGLIWGSKLKKKHLQFKFHITLDFWLPSKSYTFDDY